MLQKTVPCLVDGILFVVPSITVARSVVKVYPTCSLGLCVVCLYQYMELKLIVRVMSVF